MIICPKCGAKNELGHLFCQKCGAKLNFDNHLTESTIHPHKSMSGITKRIFYSVLIIVITAILLTFWPEIFKESNKYKYNAYKTVQSKIQKLLKTESGQQTFTQTEINTGLNFILRSQKKRKHKDSSISNINSLHIAVHETGLYVTVVEKWEGKLFNMLHLNNLKRSYCLLGTPEITNSGFDFKVSGARIGHLPIPKFTSKNLEKKAGKVFKNMKSSRAFLDSLESIELQDKKVIIKKKQ
jgi:hypothetical protein